MHELARAARVHPTTAAYHLQKLERAGLLVREEAGRRVLYYPRGQGWCAVARRTHGRLTDAARTALEAAIGGRPFARRWLEEQGITRSAARYALEQLTKAGVVERAGWGIYVLVEGRGPCARAALEERACRRCALGSTEAGPTSGRRRGAHRPGGGWTPPARDGRTPR